MFRSSPFQKKERLPGSLPFPLSERPWACRVYLVPLCYLTLGGRFPNLLEFSNGHAFDPVVLWIYHYRKGVVCNRKFNILNACLLAYLHLLCEYRARGILNIGFAAAEFLEATTCSGDGYTYPYGPPLFLLKLL